MYKFFVCFLIASSFLFRAHAQDLPLKVGHTRIDYMVSQTPESKVITNILNIQQTQAETELKRMQKELQDKFGAYQKGAAQMSDVIRKDRETELQGLQTRIQDFSRTAEESLQSKYKQLIGPVLTKIQQTIDTVAKDNGYTYIINISSGGASDVLYASPEFDITSLVMKKLDITPDQTPASPAPKTTSVKTPATPAKKAAPKKK